MGFAGEKFMELECGCEYVVHELLSQARNAGLPKRSWVGGGRGVCCRNATEYGKQICEVCPE